MRPYGPGKAAELRSFSSPRSVLDRAAEFARQRQMRVEAKRAQRLEEENAQIAEAKEAQRLRCLENAKMLRARRHRRRHDDRPPPSPALSLPPSPPPLSPPAPRHLRPRRCPPCSSPTDLHAEHASPSSSEPALVDPSRPRPLTRLDAEIAKEELKQRGREKPAPPSRGEGLEATSFLQRTVEQAEKQAARRKALIEATLAIYDHKLQQDCSSNGQKPRAARRKSYRGAHKEEDFRVPFRLAALRQYNATPPL